MLNRFQFKWNSSIKYLGILITKDTTKLFDSNYGPVNKIIKSDIDRWSQLPLEMHNRIDTIKMNMLPHLLYLLQSLPVEVPIKQFGISGFQNLFGGVGGQELNLKHCNCLKRKGIEHCLAC